jgi:hypothetical protein
MDRALRLASALALPLALTLGGAACHGTPAGDVVEVVPAGTDLEGKADLLEGNVELKITFAPAEIDAAVTRFRLTPDDATRREVYFYDTLDLTYSDAGLVLRARKTIDGPDDSTVKLRPRTAAAIDPAWLDLDGFKCEEDRVGDQSVGSCSLTVAQDRGEIDAVAAGERAVVKLYSREQEDFAAAEAGFADWDALVPLGPVAAQVWKVRVRSLEPRLTFELWTLPDDTRLLEVSARVPAADADATQAALRAYLEARGFDASSAGETKTRAALDWFAGR